MGARTAGTAGAGRGLQAVLPQQAAQRWLGKSEVWAADITYVPMARGFVYLVAIVDWFSRGEDEEAS
jgi:transposase InsO family protein